ncbi:MAG: TIGR04283 family arsenosugar biosynthesis glycosyltransferase [Verrucomicrobiales bacterium]|nr:TIGR04283 family arsenosugar biosynthesis glycosyltransferase [Verrucomicrobiales bacterium]
MISAIDVSVSIIIPTVNESATLGETLARLDPTAEVIVTDGGSSDSTEETAAAFGVKFHSAGIKSRGVQMNQAAAMAHGDFLLFLHADTHLQGQSFKNFINILAADPDIVGGGFYRFFDSPSVFLKITSHLANLRSKYWGVFLGDQGIFVRKEIFSALQGFDENLPFGEDLDFSLRLRRLGRTAAIQPAVLTSARRFDRSGPLRQTLQDFFLSLQIIRANNNRS